MFVVVVVVVAAAAVAVGPTWSLFARLKFLS